MTCQRQTRARIRSIDYASTVDPNVVQSRLKSASQRILFFFAVLFPHQSARGYNFNLVSQVCPRFTLNFEMFLFCLLTCFSATCLLIKMLKLNRFKRRFDHLPQPPSLPLIGHSLAFVAWPFSKQNSLQGKLFESLFRCTQSIRTIHNLVD